MENRIAVIGAGPVGSLAAMHALGKENTVLLFDRREMIGEPDHCAGLLSIDGLTKLGLDNLPATVIQNRKIRKAKFYSPGGFSFEVFRSSPQAIVVDRARFDCYLADLAEKKGVIIRKGYEIRRALFLKKEKVIQLDCFDRQKHSREQITSFVSIVATGVHQSLLQNSALPTIQRRHFLSGFQLLLENVDDLDIEQVEIFFGNNIAPGLFAWIIPINEHTAKVGLASSRGESRKRLELLLYKNPLTKHRFKKAKILKQYAGIVLSRAWHKKTVFPGLLLAGDAAGQTKPTTGGGVVIGGLAGILAGKTAAAAVQRGDNSRTFLKQYEHLWRSTLFHQLRAMALLRWLVNRVNDKGLDETFQTVAKEKLNYLINEEGDIDEQSAIIYKLLKQKSVLKLIFRLLPEMRF
ncbi:MAG: geranylgeranyl reductase family protein [Candidatus Heimdallarchaeota archaeon]